MLTGFNTDVPREHGTIHVQTEDSGRSRAKIETLVYLDGEILDAVRSLYTDVLDGHDVDKNDSIKKRMSNQHKSVLHSVRTGKYDPPGVAKEPTSPKPTREKRKRDKKQRGRRSKTT